MRITLENSPGVACEEAANATVSAEDNNYTKRELGLFK